MPRFDLTTGSLGASPTAWRAPSSRALDRAGPTERARAMAESMWATAELCAREGAAAQAAQMLRLCLDACPEASHPRLRPGDAQLVDEVIGRLEVPPPPNPSQTHAARHPRG